MPTLKWLLISISTLYLAIAVGLYFFQRDLIYFPPAIYKYEIPANFAYTHDGVTLRGWVVNPDREQALIYFGGNAERIDYNLEAMRLFLSGYTVYLVNYRGYGESDGIPSEAALYADALALYDEIKDNYKTVSVLGISLGSGVATYLAARRKVHKLALITPYDSLENVAQIHYPLFPAKLIVIDKFKSWQHAPTIIAPTLIVYAANDRVVPNASTENLIQYFDPKLLTVKKLADLDHSSLPADAGYFDSLADFFGNR